MKQDCINIRDGIYSFVAGFIKIAAVCKHSL